MRILFKKIWGRIFEQSPQQVFKYDIKATCTEILLNICSNEVILTTVCYSPNVFNQVVINAHYSFIGLNDPYFNLK